MPIQTLDRLLVHSRTVGSNVIYIVILNVRCPGGHYTGDLLKLFLEALHRPTRLRLRIYSSTVGSNVKHTSFLKFLNPNSPKIKQNMVNKFKNKNSYTRRLPRAFSHSGIHVKHIVFNKVQLFIVPVYWRSQIKIFSGGYIQVHELWT